MGESDQESAKFNLKPEDEEDVVEVKRCLREARDVWEVGIKEDLNNKLRSLPPEDEWIEDLFCRPAEKVMEVRSTERTRVLFDRSFERAVSRLSELWDIPEPKIRELVRVHLLCYEVEALLK